ncbi:DUF559 domain-containing protein [Microbacterium fluvii]|uniref:DUF559 domain-containing protein n=1 Tax=Microbacterium fluvii TaxID=415215 RepID=A0ABW2HCA8_9MICO|nr:type IV toxin-antitoxin system AbiEi family antitoxin domain-containing protein [Microbacterium fluvii]MCU4671736.1 DUF559 domain-containing protein [Microbacterium fluvii]
MCTSGDDLRSYRQLRDAGWTRKAIDDALGSGALRRLRRGAYAASGACEAAAAAVAHGGVLACVSAARHHGLWVLSDDQRTHVWMGRAHPSYHPREPKPCDCVVHWDRGTITDAFGLPSVTRILRQVLQCKGVEDFFAALESALRQHLIGRTGLRWLQAHTNALGREAVRLARSDADSGLESLLRWRLRAHRLAVKTQVHITGVGVVDVLIGDRLIIELDGRANHHDESHRHKDLVRDANAALWGYTTLRFDYALVVHDWALVEAAILGALAASTAHAVRPTA